MTDQTVNAGRALLIAGVVLFFGARYAVNAAMPPRRGRHRRTRGAARSAVSTPRRAPKARPPVPAPVAGGATGLLESIPYLEPARQGGRLRGTGRLVSGIALAAAIAAAVLFFFARQLMLWLESIGL